MATATQDIIHDDTQNTIDKFHHLYYNSKQRTWMNTYWFGISVQKIPLDLWIYQEIIYEIRPDVIIETGTLNGGGTLFLANMCDLIGNGIVITIDITLMPRPLHHRIYYLLGSSISDDIFTTVKNSMQSNDKVLIILDSAHDKDHVLKEMNLYGSLVSIGSYMIVEDTNINGHPVYTDFGPGPMEAIEEFLKTNKSFVPDYTKEKFFLTQNSSGYLKRIS